MGRVQGVTPHFLHFLPLLLKVGTDTGITGKRGRGWDARFARLRIWRVLVGGPEPRVAPARLAYPGLIAGDPVGVLILGLPPSLKLPRTGSYFAGSAAEQVASVLSALCGEGMKGSHQFFTYNVPITDLTPITHGFIRLPRAGTDTVCENRPMPQVKGRRWPGNGCADWAYWKANNPKAFRSVLPCARERGGIRMGDSVKIWIIKGLGR
jgi:hypothetical protein